jgi:death-on-curing protein
MEEPGRQITFPALQQIVEVNRRMIEVSGGSFVPPDNLRNRGSLEYILEAIAEPVFGVHQFQSMKEKAAALGHAIISRHVFVDGCKRTGVHAAWAFLRANNAGVSLDHTIEQLAVDMADGVATRDDFLAWLHSHQVDQSTDVVQA